MYISSFQNYFADWFWKKKLWISKTCIFWSSKYFSFLKSKKIAHFLYFKKLLTTNTLFFFAQPIHCFKNCNVSAKNRFFRGLFQFGTPIISLLLLLIHTQLIKRKCRSVPITDRGQNLCHTDTHMPRRIRIPRWEESPSG